MKKKCTISLLFCALLTGCGDILGFDCHGLIPEAPPPDPSTFRVSSKLRLGFYQTAARGWEIDRKFEQALDQYFIDALNCSAEKLHGKIYLKVLGASSIDGIDVISATETSEEYITELEAGKNLSSIFSGTLPSDFRIVLTDPFICLESNDTNGLTGNYAANGDHLFVWVNKDYPDLFRHEFLHVLDAVLGLSDEQEKSLYPCAPRAPHGK